MELSMKQMNVLETILIFVIFLATALSQKNITGKLDLSGNISQHSKFIEASPVRNVAIHPILSPKDGHIHFNVSWDRAADGTLPKRHTIQMTTLNKTDYCETDLSENSAEWNATSCIIPIVDSRTKVYPGCTYRVVVIAEDSDNRTIHPYINYTVPFCVETKCSCKEFEELEPSSLKAKQLPDNNIGIHWSLRKSPTTNSSKTLKLHITLGHQSEIIDQHDIVIIKQLRNDAQKFEGTETIIVTKSDKSEFSNNTNRVTLLPRQPYVVAIYFENEYNCTSKKKFYSFTARQTSRHVAPIHWVMNVFIPIMCFIMFIGIIIILAWRGRSRWCIKKWFCYHQQCSPPRRIYRSVTADGGRTRSFLPIPMEYNNIYIEKEILDEMERGKVDKYEICYSRLKFGAEIGKGAFGQVYLATAVALPGMPQLSTVAVKKLKKEASAEEKDEFLIEIDMLKKIGRHPNIVTLLGCCTMKQPYCMLMEYVPCGDLHRYLHALRQKYERRNFTFNVQPSHRKGSTSSRLDPQKLSDSSYIVPETPSSGRPSVTETEYTVLSSEASTPLIVKTPPLECVLDANELQSFAIQIARGMEHLESKHIIHRDLAARNVLIDGNRTLKISDFGFSRSGIYVNTKNGKVPLRWLSIEAIRDNLYTSKSDVWAYGVVLWEIGTLGAFPYPTVDNSSILNYLLQGKRLKRPENCTNELYSLMLRCWSYHTEQRPSFKSIVEYLTSISSSQRVYVDFSQLNPLYILPPTEEQAEIHREVPLYSIDSVKTIEIISPDTVKFTDKM